MSDKPVRHYEKGATRPQTSGIDFRHTARDEVDAIYANDLVKRKNRQIRRQRRAAKILPVTLAKMPWDE